MQMSDKTCARLVEHVMHATEAESFEGHWSHINLAVSILRDVFGFSSEEITDHIFAVIALKDWP